MTSKKYPIITTDPKDKKIYQVSDSATVLDLEGAIAYHKSVISNYETQKPLPRFLNVYVKRLKYFEWLKGYCKI
jgi:hypothetical protein